MKIDRAARVAVEVCAPGPRALMPTQGSLHQIDQNIMGISAASPASCSIPWITPASPAPVDRLALAASHGRASQRRISVLSWPRQFG